MATADIQKVYLGLLGRPADEQGLAYWNEQIENGTLTLEQLRANIVNEQPEFASGPGQLSRTDFIAQLYGNMFGREPSENAVYWLSGEGADINLDQLVLAFIDGASAQDTTALNYRASVAQHITNAGLALENAGRDLLQGVTNDPLTAVAAQEAINRLVNNEDTGESPPPSPTFNVSENAGILTLSGTATETVNVNLAQDTVTRAGEVVSLKDGVNLTDVMADDYNGSVEVTGSLEDMRTALLSGVDTSHIIDDVLNLMGDQGDLSNLSSITAKLPISATSYNLSNTSLDNDVDTGNNATLSITQARLTLKDTNGTLDNRDLKVVGSFTNETNYSSLTATNLGVKSITLDGSSDVPDLHYSDAVKINNDENTYFDETDRILILADGTSDDLTAIALPQLGGSMATIIDAQNSVLRFSASEYITIFETNELKLSPSQPTIIDTLDSASISLTTADDTLIFSSGDRGVNIDGFDRSGNDRIDVESILDDGSIAGSTYQTFDPDASVLDNVVVSYSSSSRLDAQGVIELFEPVVDASNKMSIFDGRQVLFVNQEVNSVNFEAQVFLVDNTSDVITAEPVVDLAGTGSLAFSDFVVA